MSGITVQTFDDEKVCQLIKNADPYLKQYIKALKAVSAGWERLFHDAMKKIRENDAQSTKDVLFCSEHILYCTDHASVCKGTPGKCPNQRRTERINTSLKLPTKAEFIIAGIDAGTTASIAGRLWEQLSILQSPVKQGEVEPKEICPKCHKEQHRVELNGFCQCQFCGNMW